MLTIATDTLPQSFLSYTAFRVSFLETLERIALARQFDSGPADGFGFLTEVPFFAGVPPQVQLDLLASTWSRHIAPDAVPASLVDEAVIYASCETAARLVEQDPTFLQRVIKSGPAELDVVVDHHLASELRALHLTLSNEGDFLMISQFEDMPPDTARRLKRQFSLNESRLEQMFDVLERWHASPDLVDRLTGLLADREIRRTARMLNLAQPAW
jgi:hypothetical protein